MAFSSGEKEMTLPAEWTDKVCSFLEAEDLLNLSATNTFWRNAVNRNSIWKPLCVKYFNVNPSEEPIIGRKCRVEPAFEIVANSSNNLSDICSWRIRYAQEIHVVNNWIHHRYAEEEVDMPGANHGFILGNSLLFTYGDGSTYNYAIWNLSNDTIAYRDRVDQLFSFRNGFLARYKNIISYYAIKGDDFELKIQTLFEQAFCPEIPLLAAYSFLENIEQIYYFYRLIRNDRYLIRFSCAEPGTIIVWDFKNLNTFSFDLSCFFSPSAVVSNVLNIGERESSILYLNVRNHPSNDCFTLYILNIQNSTIVLLHKYNFEDDFRAEIFGDSLALIFSYKIQFLKINGTSIRNVDCSNVETLINCRSYYCGLRKAGSKCYEVFLIDKSSFSVPVIHRAEGELLRFKLRLQYYLHCSCVDFFFINDAVSQRRELYNLNKFNFVELDEDFDTGVFKSNKITSHGSGVVHFW